LHPHGLDVLPPHGCVAPIIMALLPPQ